METIANWLVNLGGLYATIGVLFAVAFVTQGVGKIDPLAGRGTWGFRVLIFPGVVALWPLLAGRWARRQPPPEEDNPHRRLAREDGR